MKEEASETENYDQNKADLDNKFNNIIPTSVEHKEDIYTSKKQFKEINKIMMVISYPDIRLKKELEALNEKGFEVSLIMWERSWPFTIDRDIAKKTLKLNVPVGSLKTLFYFPIWWIYLIFWLFVSRWDVIHSVNFDTFIFSVFIAKIKQKPIVYDIFDFYGEVMEPILRPIIIMMDKFSMKFSDAIIIADDSRIQQIGSKVDNYIVTINNTPKKNLFSEKITKDNETFSIFLGGKITPQRSTEQIISAVKKVPDVKLIIKGFCAEQKYKNKLFGMISNLHNVEINLEGVPYEEIIENTMKSHLTIALYDPELPNNKYASPNKLFEAMAARIPIIVNENTSMAKIVENENCGIIIPYNDENSLIKAISCLKEDRELLRKLGDNGRKAYDNKYNWKIMEERLINIYDNVLS